MVQRNPKIISRLILVPLYITLLILLCFYLQVNGYLNHRFFAVFPRDVGFLHGVITSPFVHGDLQHLIGNLSVFTPLLVLLYYTHRKNASLILLGLWLCTGFLVWVFARPSFHIGASGVVYAIQVYILVSGMLKRRPWLMAIGAVSIMLFGGGFFFGLLPLQPHVSWESHGLGAITGLLFAVVFRNSYPYPLIKKAGPKVDSYLQFHKPKK